MINLKKECLGSTIRLSQATLKKLKESGIRYVQIKGHTFDKLHMSRIIFCLCL
jgi:hypothetical protein